jgi:gamma-glutamylcyclotransferase (GGCT)/AIG2-like uncharacterized protein YtfP/small-conductance mechanosensitive channel
VAHTPIFVYGTLLRGEANHHVLHESVPLGPARTEASFELVEFGAYTALVEGGNSFVVGELYLVDASTLEALDRLEGHPSLYHRRAIRLEDGRTAEAYVVDRHNLGRARVIPGGSFRAWSKIVVLTFAVALGLVGQATAERHRDAGSDAARDAASASAASSVSSAPPEVSSAPLLVEAPSASAAEPPPPVTSASAATQEPLPEWAGVAVKLRNARVFTVRVALGGKSAQERASGASQALQQVVEANEGANVHVDDRGDVAIVYVGERPIIQLGRDDALAAGDVSLSVHADSIASRVRDGLQQEQKRSSLLKIGITLLGVLVSGLFALFLLRRVGRVWRATRAWLTEHPDKIPALRVQSIEVVRPATLRLVLAGSVRLIAVLLQIGIAYAWLIFALYIFEPTREYTGRLTEIVLMPLSGLMSKVVTSLPSIIIATASIAALLVLVRFVGLYFESAARGETAIGWVSPDLASATSLVVRFTIVILFLVVAIPYITGTDSSLARVGLVAIVSLGLAATPMLASMCVGIAVVYGRALHPGDFINFGPHAGRIETITLLELRLHDEHGCEVRVPHLLGLFYPLRVPGKSRPVTATVTVSPKIAQPAVRQLLLEVASTIGTEPELEFFALDQGGASYRVTVRSELLDAQHRLYCAIGDALVERAVPLGTAPKTSAV